MWLHGVLLSLPTKLFVMVEPLFEIQASPNVRKQQTEKGTLYYQDFSLINRSRNTEVYFWLEVVDLNSLSLLEWYWFTTPTRIALAIKETQLATVCFEVPFGAELGHYSYAIAAKSEQALETTIRCPLQLHHDPVPLEALVKSIPSFTIDPPTTAELPCLLQPGTRLTFNITVENRSRSADRFYLACPEIPPDWFTVKYLDYGVKSGGVVQPPKGLYLNAKECGEIILTLHPPFDAPIGVYRIAVQLVSMGQPDCGIVEELYIRVLPDDRLDITLTPETQVIPQHDGKLVLDLKNRGNLPRSFNVETRHSPRLMVAIDTPNNPITLAPASETSIVLSAKPRYRWQRPVWGKPTLFPLEVSLTPVSAERNADETDSTPTVRQAYLIWRSHPSWVRKSLLLLGVGAIFAGLFVLYRFNRRPFVAPAIAEFSPTKTVYEDGNVIRLNWKLQPSKSLDRVVLARIEDGAETNRTDYDFKTSIPARLKAKPGSGCVLKPIPANRSVAFWQLSLPPIPWFSSLQAEAPASLIECKAIPVPVPKPGEYRFKLRLFSNQNQQVPVAEQITSVITIKGTSEESRFNQNPVGQPIVGRPSGVQRFSEDTSSTIEPPAPSVNQPQLLIPRPYQPEKKSVDRTPPPTPTQSPTVDPSSINPPDNPEPSPSVPTQSSSANASPTATPTPQADTSGQQ